MVFPSFLNGRVVLASILLVGGLLITNCLSVAGEPAGDAKGPAKADAPVKGEAPIKAGATLKAKVAAKPEKSPGKNPADSVSPAREAAAIEFAQKNHPEMVSLLQSLKENQPKEYRAAVLDLDRTADRLAKVKEKSPEQFEFQLADWTMTSRIRLLAARMAMSEDPETEAELRSTIRARIELRLTKQVTDRDRLQRRVEKLNESISDISSSKESLIEKEVAQLRSTIPASKPTTKSGAKQPAAAESVDVKGGK